MKNKTFYFFLSSIFIIVLCIQNCTSSDINIKLSNIRKGWAKNSINTVVFRYNSIVSFENYQFTAFYDSDGYVVLAKRELNSDNWEINKTKFNGNVEDAHNSISIMVDGNGYLHMVWNEHNSPLNYCMSMLPNSIKMSDKKEMTGLYEKRVTYPEFFKMPNGNLIYFYRDGESGNGNLVVNSYNINTKAWTNLQKNLIDGEGKRNAYWQATVDAKSIIHISWVWRESPDVGSNHDICYAKSLDGGISWQKSDGSYYHLPINAETSEYIVKIPQGSNLINQTSMCTDTNGYPLIASYWSDKNDSIPQYKLIFYDGIKWQVRQITNRLLPFSLSGSGTKKIPISRPQILCDSQNNSFLLFRELERNNRVSVAICNNIKKNIWRYEDLTSYSVGMWEPTYDTELWKNKHKLNLFVQKVAQGDGEKLDSIPPQMVSILEWKPNN